MAEKRPIQDLMGVTMEKMREMSGVEDVTLIQYNGEYHG